MAPSFLLSIVNIASWWGTIVHLWLGNRPNIPRLGFFSWWMGISYPCRLKIISRQLRLFQPFPLGVFSHFPRGYVLDLLALSENHCGTLRPSLLFVFLYQLQFFQLAIASFGSVARLYPRKYSEFSFERHPALESAAAGMPKFQGQICERDGRVHALEGFLLQRDTDVNWSIASSASDARPTAWERSASCARHQCLQASAMNFRDRMLEVSKRAAKQCRNKLSNSPWRVSTMCSRTFENAKMKIMVLIPRQAVVQYDMIGEGVSVDGGCVSAGWHVLNALWTIVTVNNLFCLICLDFSLSHRFWRYCCIDFAPVCPS